MRRGTWPSRQGKGNLKRTGHCGGVVDDHGPRLHGIEAGGFGSIEGVNHV